MGESSKIEWTDATWNPTRGCSRVSPGCDNCYAMRQAHRQNTPGGAYEGLTVLRPQTASRPGVDWSGRVRLVPEQLALPLRWRKPRRIFVDSMSDLFHPSLSDEEIAAVFGVMAAAHWHKFQVLTKRIDRAHTWFDAIPGWGCRGLTDIGDMVQEFARGAGAKVASHYGVTGWPLPNVWLGVSAENQQTANERIPHLLKCPAAVRFVSAEPLLGPLDLRHLDADAAGHEYCQVDALTGRQTDMGRPCPDVHRIHWVIVGGESGAGARPCHVDWIRSIVRQCAGAGCACFVKQLGANVRDRNDVGFDGEPGDAWDMGARLFDAVEHDPDGVRNDYQGAPVRVHLSDRKGGDPSEWPANLRVREFPAARSAT